MTVFCFLIFSYLYFFFFIILWFGVNKYSMSVSLNKLSCWLNAKVTSTYNSNFNNHNVNTITLKCKRIKVQMVFQINDALVITRSLVFYKLASTYVKNGSYSHLKKLAKNHKNTYLSEHIFVSKIILVYYKSYAWCVHNTYSTSTCLKL